MITSILSLFDWILEIATSNIDALLHDLLVNIHNFNYYMILFLIVNYFKIYDCSTYTNSKY